MAGILFTSTSKVVIGAIPIDVSLSEKHSAGAKVTAFPVEDGSNVNDHVFLEPRTLSISGFVTDSPIRILSGVRSILEGVDPGGPVGSLIFPAGLTRSASAFRALSALRDAREPVTVVTGLARYENMIITSFVVDRDKTKGRALWFSISFSQLKIVESETVAVKNSRIAKSQPVAPDAGTSNRASSTVQKGRQNVKPKATPGGSTLYNLFLGG